MRDFDWAMVAVMIAICALGVLQIFSATHDTVWQGSWWKQILYIASGFALMWGAARVDYHSMIARTYPAYLVSVVLLLAVLLVGKRAFGSTRWIVAARRRPFAGLRIRQIRDRALVARFLIDLHSDVLEMRDFLKLAGLIAIPMALIAKEPDLGTALTYIPILAVGVLLAGMRWKYWVGSHWSRSS